MRFRTLCTAAILAAATSAFGQVQTATKPGTIAPNAVTIQGCHGAATGCSPVDINGTISVAGTADVVSGGAPTTFSGNAQCTGQLLLAGEQGAGFQLNPGGTLVATLTPQYSMEASGSNWTTTQFIDQNGSKSSTVGATNANVLTQLGIVLVTGARRAQVCTTAFTSGSGTGFTVAAYVQGGTASAGGGSGTSSSFGAGFPGTGTAAGGKVVNSTPTLTNGNMEAPELTTAGRLIVDGSQVTQPSNTTQVGGTAIATGNGTTSAGTQRVTLSSDSTGQVAIAGTPNVNVSQMNGVATAMGNGTTSTGTQRVTISSDSTGQVDVTDRSARAVGTATVQQSTAANLKGQVEGTQAAGSTTLPPPLVVGGSDYAGTPAVQRAKVDSSGLVHVSADNTVTVSGTVTTSPPANASTNVAQLAGTTTDTNSGAKSAGTLRVVLATDQPQLTNKLLVTPDSVALPANQSVNVNQVAGTATAAGNGTTTAGTQRVTLSSDSTGQVAIAGTAAVNLSQVAGGATNTGNGAAAGSQRVAIANDNSAIATKADQTAPTTASWTSATTVDTAIALTVKNYGIAAISFHNSGSITAGGVSFECSDDARTTWYACEFTRTDTSGSTTPDKTYTLTGANQLWQRNVGAMTDARVRLNPVITGAGTALVSVQASAAAAGGGGSGGSSGANASVSATGSAVPASGTYIAGNKSGNLTGISLDGSGNLNVNVAAGGASGGTSSSFGSAFPATGTAIGAKDSAGTNMAALNLDASGFLKVNVAAGGGAGGTSSSFGAAFPATGTAAGGKVVNSTPTLTNGNMEAPELTTAGRLIVDGSQVTQPVSGTVTSNIGTTNGLALDATVSALQVAQGSTTSGQKGGLVEGAVTTAAPSYTTAQTSPLSLTTAGALRTDSSGTTQPVSGTVAATQSGTWTVQPGNTANTTAWKVDGSAVTQPVSGTVTSNQGGAPWTVTGSGSAGTAATGVVTVQGIASMTALKTDGSGVTQPVSGTVTTTPPANASTNVAQVGGNSVTTLASGEQKVGVEGLAASGAAKSGNPVQVGGVFNTTQPTVTTGQAVEAQATARGALIVATGTDTFNATVSGTVTTTPPSNASTNVAQFGGTNVSTGTGAGRRWIIVAGANQSNVAQVNGVRRWGTERRARARSG
jgi:hypothetical protein